MRDDARFSRREFTRMALVAVGAIAIPGSLAACSKRTSPPVTPSSLAQLADQRVRAGARKGLSVFLGGEDYIAAITNYVAFGVARDTAGPIAGSDAKVWIASGAGGEGAPSGPFAATWGGYAKPDAPAPAPQGVNATELTFDRPGVWQMLVEIDSQGERLIGTSAIQIKPASGAATLLPGASALASKTPTAKDARGVRPICTRTPACPFHTMTLAAAIRSGKPTAFIVAAPKYCMSRTCGPNLEELIAVARKTGDRANFVHAEVYRSDKAEDIQRQIVSPTYLEWKLQSEPWLFLIGRDRKIAERFEGPIVAPTIRSGLEPLLA